MVLARGMVTSEGTAARLVLIAHHLPQMRINILLTLLTSVTAMSLAVALHGLTRDVDRDLAMLALACRLGEAMLAAIAPVASLGLLWLATTGVGPASSDPPATKALGSYLLQLRGWNTTLGATLFAVGSMVFSWLLLRARMIPVPLAWLGVLASVVLVVGLPLDLVGISAGPVAPFLWLPMAAFEIPLGFWLLIKGVRAPEAA